jgi:putative endonuclease
MKEESYVYILTNKRNGTLYIGVTTNLEKRIEEHRLKIREGFTKKYNLHKLVYYEVHYSIEDAIVREKQLKHYNREWKLRLIEGSNPIWIDLTPGSSPARG